MSALWTIWVNLSPLNQTNLMIEVSASSINKVIIFNTFVQTNWALVIGFVDFHHILKVIILIFIIFIGVHVRILIWLIDHGLVYLISSFLQYPLLNRKPPKGQQIVPSVDIGLDQCNKPPKYKNNMENKSPPNPKPKPLFLASPAIEWMCFAPLPESDSHKHIPRIYQSYTNDCSFVHHMMQIYVDFGEYGDQVVLAALG